MRQLPKKNRTRTRFLVINIAIFTLETNVNFSKETRTNAHIFVTNTANFTQCPQKEVNVKLQNKYTQINQHVSKQVTHTPVSELAPFCSDCMANHGLRDITLVR